MSRIEKYTKVFVTLFLLTLAFVGTAEAKAAPRRTKATVSGMRISMRPAKPIRHQIRQPNRLPAKLSMRPRLPTELPPKRFVKKDLARQ